MPCGVYILVWGSVNGRADRLTERTKGTVGGTKKKERRKERNRKPYRHEVIKREKKQKNEKKKKVCQKTVISLVKNKAGKNETSRLSGENIPGRRNNVIKT